MDASILIEVLAGRQTAIDGMNAVLADRSVPHAPEIIDLEVASGLRRALLHGVLDDQVVRHALDGLRGMALIRHRHRRLMGRIWYLRHNLTPYDAAYLALAESGSDPVLVTADAGLATVARISLGADGVRLVS